MLHIYRNDIFNDPKVLSVKKNTSFQKLLLICSEVLGYLFNIFNFISY